MSARVPFRLGDRFEVCGIRFEVRPGRKSHDDLTLWWDATGTWHRVTLDPLFLAVDFICENEDRLYPPPKYRGGQEVIRYMQMCRIHGWRHAIDQLHRARQTKQEKLPW